MKHLIFAVALLPAAALSQTTVPTEFPADARPLSAAAMTERVSGKVIQAQPAQGPSWRLDYRDSGYVYLDTANGFRDTGRWRVEDGKLCAEWKKATSGCNEVRESGGTLYLKRMNGEVITLVPHP
jgi:hypothetical protein